MITKTRRYMSEEEQKLVERLARAASEPGGWHVWSVVFSTLSVAAVTAWTFGAVAWGLAQGGVIAGDQEIRSAATGAVVGVGFTFWLWRQFWPRRKNLDLAADRVETEVELLRVQTHGVARIGHTFFVDVGDDKCLVLRGAYVWQAFESGRFPSGDFMIVKAPHARLSLGVECHGEPLAVSEPSGPEIDPTQIPDRALVPARLATLKQDLLVLLGSGWQPA